MPYYAGKALGHGSATEQIKNFCTTASASVLILSYEAYRRDAETLNSCKPIELLSEFTSGEAGMFEEAEC